MHHHPTSSRRFCVYKQSTSAVDRVSSGKSTREVNSIQFSSSFAFHFFLSSRLRSQISGKHFSLFHDMYISHGCTPLLHLPMKPHLGERVMAAKLSTARPKQVPTFSKFVHPSLALRLTIPWFLSSGRCSLLAYDRDKIF